MDKIFKPCNTHCVEPPRPQILMFQRACYQKWCWGFCFSSSIGAKALQVTLTLNFGGEGVVPDRRGLNISSIYGMCVYYLHISYIIYHISLTEVLLGSSKAEADTNYLVFGPFPDLVLITDLIFQRRWFLCALKCSSVLVFNLNVFSGELAPSSGDEKERIFIQRLSCLCANPPACRRVLQMFLLQTLWQL